MDQEIKIQKESMRDLVSRCRTQLDLISQVQSKLEQIIGVFEEQQSPAVIGDIHEKLKIFKGDVDQFSTDRITATLDAIDAGVMKMEEQDNQNRDDFQETFDNMTQGGE